jgi:ComF family protein
MNFLHSLFPASCVLCKRPFGIVCLECQPDFAIRLSLSTASALPIYIASQDQDRLISRLLFAWKYKGIRDAGTVLQCVWYEAFLQLPVFDGETICVPVPLHWLKHWQRGFNQAELLARFVVQAQLATTQRLLKRTVFTQSQVGKNKEERTTNVAGVFQLSPKKIIHPQARIILVDDIVTSGSTLLICQRVLHQAGFHHIVALVLHRGTH